MSIVNALPQLRLMGFDEHTAVAALSSALEIGGHAILKRKLIYGDEDKGFTVIFNRYHRVSKIEVTDALWERAKRVLEADKATGNPTKIVHTILFSGVPLKGYCRVDDWLQLSPVRTKLLGSNPFGVLGGEIDINDKWIRQIPHPFILEVKYRSSSLIWVESIERHRALDNARRLLSAWITQPIVKGIESYNWVMINGVGPQIAQGCMTSGLDDFFANATDFSDVSGFPPVPFEQPAKYVDQILQGDGGLQMTDILSLKCAFEKLSRDDQIRYLRCCSAIHEAEYYSRHTSQAIVSYVSAVEALLDEVDQCATCGSHVGISAAFKEFVNRYVQPSEANRVSLGELYAWRSRFAHGAYALAIDEPFMGLQSSGGMMSFTALWIAKKGAINWLLERAK